MTFDSPWEYQLNMEMPFHKTSYTNPVIQLEQIASQEDNETEMEEIKQDY